MEKNAYKKTEKWWLALTVIFYLFYNLPGVPKYGDTKSAVLHGILTLVPLWSVIYIGLFRISRQRELKGMPNNTKESGE